MTISREAETAMESLWAEPLPIVLPPDLYLSWDVPVTAAVLTAPVSRVKFRF